MPSTEGLLATPVPETQRLPRRAPSLLIRIFDIQRCWQAYQITSGAHMLRSDALYKRSLLDQTYPKHNAWLCRATGLFLQPYVAAKLFSPSKIEKKSRLTHAQRTGSELDNKPWHRMNFQCLQLFLSKQLMLLNFRFVSLVESHPGIAHSFSLRRNSCALQIISREQFDQHCYVFVFFLCGFWQHGYCKACLVLVVGGRASCWPKL